MAKGMTVAQLRNRLQDLEEQGRGDLQVEALVGEKGIFVVGDAEALYEMSTGRTFVRLTRA